MSGRTVIVTGASSGLGYEVARYLCEGGNDVILACRNKEKADRAIEKIKRANPNALATFMELDLASKESIAKFVTEFHDSERKLHVLINNAGIALGWKDTKIQLTADNFELTMGTNHLGPFMLTNMLLEDLKKTAGEEGGEARIVMVTSSMHNPDTLKQHKKNLQPLDLEDLFSYKEGVFNGVQAYKNSKLANIMFSSELVRKLEGSNVTVNCVNPGFIPSTDLMRNASGASKFFARVVLHTALRFTKMTRTVAQGATSISTVAVDEKYKGVTGKYYCNGEEAETSDEAKDEEKQTKLFQISGGYLHMEGFEELETPQPPPPKEDPKDKKKEAKEAKNEEEKKEGEEGEAKTEGEQKEGEQKEGEETAVKKEGGEVKADNKTDEEKEVKTEEVEEKKDDEKEKEEVKPAEEIKDEIQVEKEKIEASEKPAETPAEIKA